MVNYGNAYKIYNVFLFMPDLRKSSSSSSGEPTTSISGSDSSGDSDSTSRVPEVDLTLKRLESLHSSGSVPKKDLSDYAKHGISSKRIKSAVLEPRCECMCKMPVKILYHLCVAFWTLTKQSQDSLLWSLQNETGNHKKRRCTWQDWIFKHWSPFQKMIYVYVYYIHIFLYILCGYMWMV